MAFNLTSNTFLVSADAGGTGKYLEINFLSESGTEIDNLALLASECTVSATKFSSGQTFTYVASASDSYSQKVGAGTVLLDALADTDNGWDFSYFVIRDVVSPDLSDYKTKKYDIVDAVFSRQPLMFDIAVYVDGGFGEVWLGDEFIADQTNDEFNPVIVPVEYGSTPRFEFIPYENELDSYHLSSVFVNDNYYVDLVLTEFTQSYEYPPIIEDAFYSLVVTFSLDGEAVIPSGSDITVFLSSAVSLTFNSVEEGTAFGSEIFSAIDVVIWDIDVVTFNLGDQTLVALRYDPSRVVGAEEDLRLYRSDSEYAELFYKCDFNDDGVVDGQDVKIIANIVKHPKFWDPNKNPEYNLNEDNVVDEDDLHIVNSMKNLDLNWIDITVSVDTVNNIIYGETDHFSIFRGR